MKQGEGKDCDNACYRCGKKLGPLDPAFICWEHYALEKRERQKKDQGRVG